MSYLTATATVSGVFTILSGSISEVLDGLYKRHVKGDHKIVGFAKMSDTDNILVMYRV